VCRAVPDVSPVVVKHPVQPREEQAAKQRESNHRKDEAVVIPLLRHMQNVPEKLNGEREE
jgi:hypothetical protein